MSKKLRVGIDLKCNIQNDCELFNLSDFEDYDFYNKFAAQDSARAKTYNVLAGNKRMLKNAEFSDTWENIARAALRHTELFVDKVYNQEFDRIEIELAEINIEPLSVNASLTDIRNRKFLRFDVDVISEITFNVTLTHLYDEAAVAASIADKLELYIRKELDYAAVTSISFIL